MCCWVSWQGCYNTLCIRVLRFGDRSLCWTGWTVIEEKYAYSFVIALGAALPDSSAHWRSVVGFSEKETLTGGGGLVGQPLPFARERYSLSYLGREANCAGSGGGGGKRRNAEDFTHGIKILGESLQLPWAWLRFWWQFQFGCGSDENMVQTWKIYFNICFFNPRVRLYRLSVIVLGNNLHVWILLFKYSDLSSSFIFF